MRRRHPILFWSLFVLVLLLIGVRVMLPVWVTDYVNRTLNRIPEYSGQIHDVDLALIRGAYVIKELRVTKNGDRVPVPLVVAPRIDLSVQWRALFQRKFVGEIYVENPELTFARGSSEASTQLSVDSEWLKVVKDLFPLRINRFQIEDGIVRYRDLSSNPKIDIEMSEVEVVGTNLSNTRTPTDDSLGQIEFAGLVERQGRLKGRSLIQVAAVEPTFQLNASLENLPVPNLNDFLRAYAGVDAEAGVIDVYTEMAAEKGLMKGYVKPLVRDLTLLQIRKDDTPLTIIWEGIVAFFAEIFQNQPRDQLGTRVEFVGKLNDPKTSTWSVFLETLRNAFVEALKPGTGGGPKLSNSTLSTLKSN